MQAQLHQVGGYLQRAQFGLGEAGLPRLPALLESLSPASLQQLRFDHQVPPAVLSTLVPRFTQLERLALDMAEPDSCGAAAVVLRALPHLHCFSLGVHGVPEELLAAVASATQLTALMLWSFFEPLPLLGELTALSRLQRLVLAEDLSTEQGLQPPTPFQRHFPHLRHCVFGVCGMAGDHNLVKVPGCHARLVRLAWTDAPHHPQYADFVLSRLTEQDEEEGCELELLGWLAAGPGRAPAIELRPALEAILTPAMPPVRALITDTLNYAVTSLSGCNQLSSLTRLVFDDVGRARPDQASEVLQAFLVQAPRLAVLEVTGDSCVPDPLPPALMASTSLTRLCLCGGWSCSRSEDLLDQLREVRPDLCGSL